MSRALVTGASGFIGFAVARAAQRAGLEVRVTRRATTPAGNLERLDDVEIVTADLLQPDTLRAAVRGVEVVFHAAADYRLWSPDPDALYRANVDGTVALAEAAALEGVATMVYTSSVATIGLNADDTVPADEDTPAGLADMIGHYKRSKFLAETRLRERAATSSTRIVIVNPSAPIGPFDVKPTPTGQTIADIAHGRMPAYVDTGLNIVHVDDVANGHVLALERGQPGRRYILGGEDMTMKAIIDRVCAITGRRAPWLRLPYAAVLPIAHVSEWIAGRTGRPPRAPLEGVRLARKKMFFTSARAEAELGYAPRPAEAAIRDAVAWFTDGAFIQRGKSVSIAARDDGNLAG